MATFEPAEVFPPGEIIKVELEARGWTQADLAEVMERPLQMVNEIVRAKKRVTEETAKELEEALGIDAEFWLRTEARYRLRHGEPAPSAIARRAALRRRVPFRLMVTRGWLNPSDNVDESEKNVLAYLGVTKLDEHPEFAMAAKQTEYNAPLSETQEVWLLRVKRIAETMQLTPAYSSAKLKQAITHFRDLLSSPEDVSEVPKLLNDAGVRFVIVERLPGLKIDGVCFWLSNDTQPVIGLSLRHDRIDNFWFVLRHECEHVLQNHGKGGAAIVDNDLDHASNVSEQERIANSAASEFCVPRAVIDDFLIRKGELLSDVNVRQLAHSRSVHPGIIAGQVRKRLSEGPLGEQAWKLFSSHLVKIRHVITSTALVDGFGTTLNINPT